MTEPQPPRWLDVAWFMFCRALIFPAVRGICHTRVVGAEHIPRKGACIIAPTHRSYVDTLLTAYLSRRRMRFMAKEEIFSTPLGQKLFTSLGGFPVRRGAPDREALRLCEQILSFGEPLVLFPEGTRRSGPEVTDLHAGAAFVSVRTGVPIIPVGIWGSEKALPPGAKMVRPARIGIVAGQPIYPPARSATGASPRNAVKDMTAQLADELQALYDEARGLVAGRST